MTIEINGAQLVLAAGVALVGPTAAALFSELRRHRQHTILEAQRAVREMSHDARLQKIEAALGIENPNEVAFWRVSDGKRIEATLETIRREIGNGHAGKFARVEETERRFTGLETTMVADHALLREHTGQLGDHGHQLRTLRRDVDGLMAADS